MAAGRSTSQRAAYLAVAVILIIGGITGLAVVNGHVISKIGAAVAILVGLGFLRLAATTGRR